MGFHDRSIILLVILIAVIHLDTLFWMWFGAGLNKLLAFSLFVMSLTIIIVGTYWYIAKIKGGKL